MALLPQAFFGSASCRLWARVFERVLARLIASTRLYTASGKSQVEDDGGIQPLKRRRTGHAAHQNVTFATEIMRFSLDLI